MDYWRLVGFLTGLAVALAVMAVVRGLLIRAAIGVYTWHAGMTSNVPMPTIGRAIEIAVAAIVAGAIAGFEVGLNIGALLPAAGASAQTTRLTALSATLPVGIAITGAILSFMLPTKFSKGVHVAICELLLGVIVVAVALSILYFVSLAFSQ